MSFLEVPALAMSQSPGKVIYSFGIDAKRIPEFAAVSRIGRGDEGELLGYQRPEVRRHISDIRSYIESEAPMVPNALVLAFDQSVVFTASGPTVGESTPGTLRIPIPPTNADEKVGWIVDGQQRVAAIREAKVEGFPMFAIGFIARSDSEAREQFMLVNSTKPLPKSLIYELLPGVDAHLPAHLAKRRLPTQIIQVLNNDKESPLYQAIATATNNGARIKDNSIIKFLENSLSDGLLYRIRLVEKEAAGPLVQRVLFDFWLAVRDTWPELWDLKPRKSRLLHGAGVVTLGYLMDSIADLCRDGDWPDYDHFLMHLVAMKPHCRWNEGFWEFGPETTRKWDQLQNTSKDINLLTNHLMRIHRKVCREMN